MALRRRGIDFTLRDNAFLHIEDWKRAQQLADTLLPIPKLRYKLNQYARQYCPPSRLFTEGYHWSLMQVEYATDIVFRLQQDLIPLYESLSRTAVHAVKAEQIGTFLGRPLHPLYRDEVGNRFETRIEGTCIKHQMGPVSIKMYDKFGLILRIETTTNQVSFFKHYRRVVHRDGTGTFKLAPLKKTIYSLPVLVELMAASNRRYLEFLSTLDDPTPALRDLEKIARPVRENERSLRGFNLFDAQDLDLFVALVRGEFNISGFQNHHLRRLLGKNGHQVSLILKRLRLHGLIKKVGRRYKYYLTALGRKVIATALRLREIVIIPSLTEPAAA